ncbi:MAG TPA: hypothetical protein VL463_25310 [Kofleriaceae bacterium]|nr:hypothetical protein [Kofleriaceae bacterium]
MKKQIAQKNTTIKLGFKAETVRRMSELKPDQLQDVAAGQLPAHACTSNSGTSSF